MNVLIVEDETRNGLFLRELLLRYDEAIRCHFAKTVSQGLCSMESNKYDLLFLDIQLPDKNGLELLKEIRARNDQTPVCVLSAFDRFEYAQGAIQLGAFDYLVKPISYSALLETLNRWKETFANKILNLPFKKGVVVVNVKEVMTVHVVARNRIKLRLRSGEEFDPIYLSLSQIEKQLSRDFIRVSRQDIVNSQLITTLNLKERIAIFHIPDKEPVDVKCSRTKIMEVMRLIHK